MKMRGEELELVEGDFDIDGDRVEIGSAEIGRTKKGVPVCSP